jgi:hypothetical protein
MDNVISSVHTSDALSYYESANTIMDDGNLPLRAWTSNDPTIRDRAKADKIDDPNPSVPVLGMLWDIEADELTYNPRNKPQTLLPTKREAISYISGKFDPLGYIAPTHAKAKQFIQMIWQSGTGWDEFIPDDLADKFQDLAAELEEAQTISIPRQLIPNINVNECELHIFSDASPS